MTLATLKTQIIEWFALNASPLAFTALVVLVYLLLNRVIAQLVRRADRRESRQGAAVKVIKAAQLITGFFSVLTIMVAWGIDFSSVTIFASTTITLLGVALFASWSLLSNVTAYFVLLFHPSFSRGTFVRIIEADNYVEGYVADLSLFSIELITEAQEKILYPNNLLLGRVTIVDPKDRLNRIGKVVNPTDTASM